MKNNTKRPRRKSNSKRDRNVDFEKSEREEMSSRRAGNDPAWYAADPALLRDAASIPFSWSTGTSFNLGKPNGAKATPTYVVPGINVLYTVPSISYAANPNDPINVAANATFAFVRKANSGTANYNAPDLMLYIMSMADVYSYINFLQRAYGMATLYSQRNRYLPDALLAACGIDAEDVHEHLADFRYGINVLINKAASFAVPATMSIFQREAFLYRSLYTEGTSIKDQLYMYAPAAFRQFELIDNSGALNIRPFLLNTPAQTSGQIASFSDNASFKYYTVSELLDYGSTMLNPLLMSEDFNIMSGDILKAYGDNIIKLASLPTEYPLVPEFNIGVLEQMKNATILPDITAVASDSITLNLPTIVQDSTKGYLQSTPSIIIKGVNVNNPATASSVYDSYDALFSYLSEGRILTTTTSEVTPELVIESTRLMTVATREWLSNNSTYRLYSGAEIVVGAVIWHYSYAQLTGVQSLSHTSYAYIGEQNSISDTWTADQIRAMMNTRIRRHALLENFDFHSQVHELTVVRSTTEQTVDVTDYGFAFDIDNYAVLTAQDIFRMHEAALLNMLHVPSIAKLS